MLRYPWGELPPIADQYVQLAKLLPELNPAPQLKRLVLPGYCDAIILPKFHTLASRLDGEFNDRPHTDKWYGKTMSLALDLLAESLPMYSTCGELTDHLFLTGQGQCDFGDIEQQDDHGCFIMPIMVVQSTKGAADTRKAIRDHGSNWLVLPDVYVAFALAVYHAANPTAESFHLEAIDNELYADDSPPLQQQWTGFHVEPDGVTFGYCTDNDAHSKGTPYNMLIGVPPIATYHPQDT